MNIEEAKDIYEGLKRNEHIVKIIDKEFFFRFADTVLNELEKKDKVIDEMASRLSYVEDLKLDVCVYCKEDCRIPKNEGDFIKTDCIKEYFYKKGEVKK